MSKQVGLKIPKVGEKVKNFSYADGEVILLDGNYEVIDSFPADKNLQKLLDSVRDEAFSDGSVLARNQVREALGIEAI